MHANYYISDKNKYDMMNSKKIQEHIKSNPSSSTSKLVLTLYNFNRGLLQFSALITGYIPSHVIRHVFYRQIFKMQVPSDSIIYRCCRLVSPSGIRIGHNSIIGDRCVLDGRSNLIIGNNVNIGGDTHIHTMEHDINSPTFASIGGPVNIGDNVYLGTNVIILPDVTIGEGAVVASGAVVTKDVEPWTLVGGVPAKFIKKRPKVKYTLDTSQRLYFW